MNRALEISILRRRYKDYTAQHRWAKAALIWPKLRYLIKQQLKAESRQDRKVEAKTIMQH